MSRDWGGSNFGSRSYGGKTLLDVISPLPPRVKQAMYAAAEKNLIQRRTWNGCAWNAAGLEAFGQDIQSSVGQANLFEVKANLVSNFIGVWDSMSGSDEYCTRKLKETLLEVGLQTEPQFENKVAVRIVTGYLYKSEETAFKEKFDKVVADLDLNEESILAQDVQEISQMLNASEREEVLLG